jgi:hypothetical protein
LNRRKCPYHFERFLVGFASREYPHRRDYQDEKRIRNVFHTKNNLWLANLTIFSRNGKFLIEKVKTITKFNLEVQLSR